MTTKQQREIVIEYERVQLIRKRAKTETALCPRCGANSDFVRLSDAAALFEIPAKALKTFVLDNAVHYSVNGNFGSGICIASLLSVMQESRTMAQRTSEGQRYSLSTIRNRSNEID